MFANAQYQPQQDVHLFVYLFIYFYFILLKVGTILVLTGKNQPANQKYFHTYIE